MLDPQSLSQLRQLKQQLNDAIERAEGTVVAAQAQGRFGFVKLDDGRETFLPPEEMQRVFPGDRVQVRVLPAAEADRPRGGKGRRRERPRAELEKLLDSPLEHFTGHYVTRGNAHFVVPDLPQLERWLFLPSQARGAARPGDLVRARILRHPFRSGRPQAEVIDRLGSPEEPFIEARYAAARWQLPAGAPEAPPLIQPALDERLDLTGLPLVTIDDPETMDLDDALHAVAHAEGWTLWVAIADPLPWLAAEPGLQKLAADRLGSIYLPGVEYPMLPTSLAHGEAALQADRPRPALVCEIDLAPDGDIRRHQWHRALVRPRARHSYEELADELTRADSSSPLATLAAAAAALRSHRLEHSASMAERPDYHLQLNEAGRLQDIQRRYKTEAHQLVEECMLAANRCAAAHLAADRGLFVTHGGFRPERLGDVRNLTGEYLPELAGADPQSLEGYQAIMRAAAPAEAPPPRPPLWPGAGALYDRDGAPAPLQRPAGPAASERARRIRPGPGRAGAHSHPLGAQPARPRPGGTMAEDRLASQPASGRARAGAGGGSGPHPSPRRQRPAAGQRHRGSPGAGPEQARLSLRCPGPGIEQWQPDPAAGAAPQGAHPPDRPPSTQRPARPRRRRRPLSQPALGAPG